jgi:hypothetical protein
MDTVRFARALGRGTRAAATALMEAADAATAPNPNASQAQNRTAPRPPAAAAQPVARPEVAAQVVEAVQKVRVAQSGIKQGSRNFVQASTAPMVKAGKVLWLEVTGSLFGLFAAASALEVFRHRAGLHTVGDERKNLLLAVLMFVVFAAFTVSSFRRAGRKARS